MTAWAIANSNDALTADCRDLLTALTAKPGERVLGGGCAVGAYDVIFPAPTQPFARAMVVGSWVPARQ